MLRAISAGTGLVPWSSPGMSAPPDLTSSSDIAGTVTVTAAWRRSQSSWVGQVSVTVWMYAVSDSPRSGTSLRPLSFRILRVLDPVCR